MDIPPPKFKGLSNWADSEMDIGENDSGFSLSVITSGSCGESPMQSPAISRRSSNSDVSSGKGNLSVHKPREKTYQRETSRNHVTLNPSATDVHDRTVFILGLHGYDSKLLKNELLNHGINVLVAWCLPDIAQHKAERPLGYAIFGKKEDAKILIENNKRIPNKFSKDEFLTFKVPQCLEAKPGQNPLQVRVKGTVNIEFLTEILRNFDTGFFWYKPHTSKSNVAFILTFTNNFSATLAVKRLKYYRDSDYSLDAELGLKISV